jgi:hypothetical protein
VVGLSFADEQDARVLYNAVTDVRLRSPAPTPVPQNNNATLHPGAPAPALAHSTSGLPPPRLQTPAMGALSASTSSLSAPVVSRPPLSPRNRTLVFSHLRTNTTHNTHTYDTRHTTHDTRHTTQPQLVISRSSCVPPRCSRNGHDEGHWAESTWVARQRRQRQQHQRQPKVSGEGQGNEEEGLVQQHHLPPGHHSGSRREW